MLYCTTVQLLLISSVSFASNLDFDSTELFHLFGISEKENAPVYWIDEPTMEVTASGLLYTVKIGDEQYKFRLRKNDEIFSPGFHSVDKYGDVEEELKFGSHHAYIGESTTHSNTTIAIVTSGDSSSGLIISNTGHYLIHPVIRNKTHCHVIHKRSPDSPDVDDDYINADYINSVVNSVSGSTALDMDELTIELGVFVDDALWIYFTELYEERADIELQRYVLAIVNNIAALFGHSSMEPKIHIKIIRYEVMKTIPPQLNRRYHFNGEVEHLLEIFCKYQRTLNDNDDYSPRHWDHALLLSGYDLYRPGMHAIAGYAPVNMMCSYDRSCTINEGLDFGSVFVIAHEIGHRYI